MTGEDTQLPSTSEYLIAGAWNDSFKEQHLKDKNVYHHLKCQKGINILLFWEWLVLAVYFKRGLHHDTKDMQL